MRKGINIYGEARFAFGKTDEKTLLEHFSGSGKAPCIFLSHQSSDKAAVKAIGEYITNAGINIYMDIDDLGLQAAVASNNHDAITVFIERGIAASSDLMTCVSKQTFNSCWVPYEIGFGKSAEKYLSALRLNDITSLPSYLNIRAVDRLNGVEELNAYLKTVQKRNYDTQNFSGNLGYLRKLTEAAEIDESFPSVSAHHSLRNFLDR